MDMQNLLTGHIPSEFDGILRKGKFVKKSNMESGDIVEFLYDSKRKYIFVLNPFYEGKVHGVDLEHLSNQEFIEVIRQFMLHKDPETLYDSIKHIVSETRSYRTYTDKKITRARTVRYEKTVD